MRIVGGKYGGRVLKAPISSAIRPTSERVRESLFNILSHAKFDADISFDLDGARVLDLFAGTGALSFEALSRGASFAALVDVGTEARGIQRENIERLGLGGITRILKRDATKLGQISSFPPFSLVFCDPPYDNELGEQALNAAAFGGWLSPNALVVLEERAKHKIELPSFFKKLDHREAGDTQIIFSYFRGLY